MKVRNGFVSNSSSSSFVILGVRRNGIENEDGDIDIDEEDLGEGIDSLYVEGEEYDYVTGFILADGEEYLEDNSISFSELKEMAEKVSKALNVDIEEVKLIMGTRPC
jgi:hypothetical protein